MAKLVLALALGAQALLAPSNKLPANTVRRAAYISRCLRCQQGPVSLGGLKVATEHRSRR